MEAFLSPGGSMIDLLDRVDATSTVMIEALRAEHQVLSGEVRTEREALTDAADTQRKALAHDAAEIANRVVRSSGEEVRYLVREVLLMLIVLSTVLLALPFAAGYVVGRARSVRTGNIPNLR